MSYGGTTTRLVFFIVLASFIITVNLEDPVRLDNLESDDVLPDPNSNLEDVKSHRVKRQAKITPVKRGDQAPAGRTVDAASIDTAGADGADPFTTSIKWAAFVQSADVIIAGAKTIIKSITDSLAATNEGFSADKTAYLSNYSAVFSELFRALPEFFEPLHEQLVDSAAYSKINPAIGLNTFHALNELAKSNPPEVLDKTRIKLVEINAMAITVHHIFDRLGELVEKYGLAEIDGVMAIGYPSWMSKNAPNETADLFEDKNADALAEHIHVEMTSLGDSDHLFRGLEKILRKKLVKVDPSSTDSNFFCYGNNEFGLIHDEFDLLTDAAQFLVMADIKYCALQVVSMIHKQWKSLSSPDTAPAIDVSKELEDIVKNFTEKIDRKIKFATAAAVPKDAVIPGPTTFKCDLPPKPADPTKGPTITSDAFPPGVYLQNNSAYNPDGTPLKNDPDGIPLLENGAHLPAELRPVWQGPDGVPLPQPVKLNDKGEPLGDDGQPVPGATKVPLLIPIDSKTPKQTSPEYPMTEWGILPPSGLTPKSNGIEPALDPQTGPNMTDGFPDERFPNLLAAQFAKAYSGYLEAEQVLNNDGSCAGSCLDYTRSTMTCNNKTEHCAMFRQSVCEPGKNCLEKSNCPSKARRCIRTGSEVSFCPSAGNTTLYDWIRVNGKLIGLTQNDTGDASAVPENTNTCAGGEVQLAKERWEMEFGVIVNAPQYCEVCLCVCDDPLVADGFNYFNIEEIVSNVTNGFVVTSVRFEKGDHVIRLSIEESKLIGDGTVDPTTSRWIAKELNKDKNVQLGVSGFKKLNLDVVYGLPFEVVTGLRLKQVEDSLSLEVQFTKLTGQGLIDAAATSEWKGANYPVPQTPRTLINLKDLSNPLTQKGPSQPFHVPDNSKTVEFDASSLEKDGGNAVIPWFDLQPVQHYSGRKGLSSVGILYKSKRGSGGFLSPAVTVYKKAFAA